MVMVDRLAEVQNTAAGDKTRQNRKHDGRSPSTTSKKQHSNSKAKPKKLMKEKKEKH